MESRPKNPAFLQSDAGAGVQSPPPPFQLQICAPGVIVLDEGLSPRSRRNSPGDPWTCAVYLTSAGAQRKEHHPHFSHVKESRRLKTLETKEDPPLTLKGVTNAGSSVDSSEKPERLFPRDCAEIYKQGIQENGIYTIQPIPLRPPFEAYCDMFTDGGGWTVFQRRQDGSVDFNRTWQDYKQGFGSLQGEHWLGNENLHSLTRLGQHILRIELEDWYGVKRYAIYRKFKVASELNKYRLTAREYQGNAGNALSYSRNYNHDHKQFTTYDTDNDNYPSGNCGTYYGTGWWFDACLAANLNGKYHKGRYSGVTSGIYWGTWYILTDKRTKQKYSFKRVEMKTRILNA